MLHWTKVPQGVPWSGWSPPRTRNSRSWSAKTERTRDAPLGCRGYCSLSLGRSRTRLSKASQIHLHLRLCVGGGEEGSQEKGEEGGGERRRGRERGGGGKERGERRGEGDKGEGKGGGGVGGGERREERGEGRGGEGKCRIGGRKDEKGIVD